MSFRDSIRKLAFSLRALPGQFGVRPYSVAIQVTTSAGAEIGEGLKTVVTTPITEGNGQPPKVRWLSSQELALGGYGDGTVKIGPITPDFPGGGTALATLHPDPGANATVRVILTGPDHPTGGAYRIRNVDHDRAFGYSITVERAVD